MKGKKILSLIFIFITFFVIISNNFVSATDILNSVSYYDLDSSASNNKLDNSLINSNGSMDKYILKDGKGYALFTDSAELYSDVFFDIIYKVDEEYTIIENVKASTVFKVANDYIIMIPTTKKHIPEDYNLDDIYAVRLAYMSTSNSTWFDLRVTTKTDIFYSAFTENYNGHEPYIDKDNFANTVSDRHIIIDQSALSSFNPLELFYLYDKEEGEIDLESDNVSYTYDYDVNDTYLRTTYNYTLTVSDSNNNVRTENLYVHVVDTKCPIELSYLYYVPISFDLNIDNIKDILMIKDDFSKPEDCVWKLSDETQLEEFKASLANKETTVYDITVYDESGNEADDTISFCFLEDTSPSIYINKLTVTESVYNSWTNADMAENMLDSIKTIYPSATNCKIVEETENPDNNTINVVYSVNTDEGIFVNNLTVLKNSDNTQSVDSPINGELGTENESSSKKDTTIVKIICGSVLVTCIGISVYLIFIKKR